MFYDEELDLDILKPYFSRAELAAPDGTFKLAPGFAEELVRLRITFDRPMVINSKSLGRTMSGCRTSNDVGNLLERGYEASVNSFHLVDNKKYKTNGCCAVDVYTANQDDKYRERLIDIALRHSWSIGLGKSFIHLDKRTKYTNLPRKTFSYGDTR